MQKLKSTEQQQHTCGRFITITAEAVLTGAVVIEDVVVEPGVSGTVTITARIDLHSTENLTNSHDFIKINIFNKVAHIKK